MPVCIAGMHCSGTSMVARLLNLCGLYLGPEDDLWPSTPDNPEGYWENIPFNKLNDEILNQLDGDWKKPPAMPEGWELRPEMIPLQRKATDLILRFSSYEPWGWKDPRNSITLPFWKRLIPNLKVVICLRNPLEVEQSLRNRIYSPTASGLNLWLTYNQRLLSSVHLEVRVITHYDAYFCDPREELRRVLGMLNIPASEEPIDRACPAASLSLRRNRFTSQDLLEAKLPADLVKCYMDMCAEAGPVYQMGPSSEPVARTNPIVSVQTMRRWEAQAREALAAKDTHIANLEGIRKQLEEVVAAQQGHVRELEQALAAKDTHIANLEGVRRQLEEVVAAQQGHVRKLEEAQAEQQVHLCTVEEEYGRAVQALHRQLAETQQRLHVLETSLGCKLQARVRQVRMRFAPPASRRERTWQLGIRFLRAWLDRGLLAAVRERVKVRNGD